MVKQLYKNRSRIMNELMYNIQFKKIKKKYYINFSNFFRSQLRLFEFLKLQVRVILYQWKIIIHKHQHKRIVSF